MKTKFLLLLSLLFLTCVQPVCADTVIPLSLVEDSNDGPAQDGKDPITPNLFAVTLDARTLFVQTEVNETMYLQIQNEQTKEIVLDTRFNNSISYQMINYGSYWLYLTCKNTKLVGHFQIEMSQNEAADIVLKMFETKEDVEIFVSNDMYTVGDTVRLMKMLGVEDIVVDAKSWVAYVDLYPNANLSHDFQYFLIDACSGKTSDYMRGWPPDKSIELFASFRSIDWRQGLKVPTPQSAFEVVDNMFKDDTVSIYISKDLHYGGTAIDLYFGDKLKIPTPIVPYWVAFVDLYPMANWNHPCEYVLIDAYSRNIIRIKKNWFPATEDEFSLFRWDTKSEKTGLLNTKDISVGNKKGKIISKAMKDSGGEEEDNRWAIIINGGLNPDKNRTHFWNDCATIFKTLLNYGYDYTHIFVANADGTDSGLDMICNNGIKISSPLDFNNDDINDIRYRANRNGIITLFDDLSREMQPGDDLFIFTTDHGGLDNGHSVLCLWDNTKLYDYEFASMVSNLGAGNVNILMEQCHSGGFIDDFQYINYNDYVITTACSTYESSSAYRAAPLDEFVYWWCAAVNGVTPNNLMCNSADFNNDGYVSMREAYVYACMYDELDKSPQQYSNDNCLKYSLTLTNLLNLCDDSVTFNGSDIYIKDNPADFGAEPNISTSKHWISTDIWFEELNGGQVNSLQQGSTYKVCARIYNRGNQASPGGELIYWHWTKAVIGGSWPYSWYDNYDYSCDNTPIIRGAVINPYGTVIPSLNAGESTIVYDYWTVPVLDYSICSVFDDDIDQLWHYCLLARIVDLQDQPGEDLEEQPFSPFVLNHNNVASRNFSIISDLNTSSEGLPAAIVGVVPPYMQSDYYHIYCDLLDTTMELGGNVHLYVTLSPDMYSNWLLHGSGFYDIDGLGRLEITANHAELLDIYMNGSELYPIKVEIEQTSNLFCDVQFDIYLVNQHDSILGGERFRYNGDGTNRFVINPSISDSQHASHSQSGFDITCTPNPVTSTLFVSSSEEIISIDIYDIDGQNVISTGETTIDVSRLSKGIYMVIAESANGYGQTKFVKQ